MIVHVFCDYNLAIILIFAVLVQWFIQHQLNCEQLFVYNVIWVTCWVWMEMLMPEFKLDVINLGCYYHCLPIRIYHW